MKKSMKVSFIYKLFTFLIITCSIPFVFQAIAIGLKGSYILWTYENPSTSSGVARIFPYLKDYIVIFTLICLSMTSKKREVKYLLFFLGISVYGFLVQAMYFFLGPDLQYFSFVQYITGIRQYIYLTVCIISMLRLKIYLRNRVDVLTIHKIIRITFLINVFFSILFIFNSGSLLNFGVGGRRISGVFPNSGTLGCYTIGIIMYITVLYIIRNYIGRAELMIFMVLDLFMALASGMRSAQLIVLLFIFINLLYIMFSVFKINKNKITLYSLTLIAILTPVVLSYLVSRTGRGGLMDSGSMRLTLFRQLFQVEIGQLIFGRGLGYGTNTAVVLQLAGFDNLDNTISTIISQFGLIGFVIFWSVVVYFTIWILNLNEKFRLIFISILISILIIFMTGNIFEQYVLIVFLTYSVGLSYYNVGGENFCDRRKKNKLD